MHRTLRRISLAKNYYITFGSFVAKIYIVYGKAQK